MESERIKGSKAGGRSVVILYRRSAAPDEQLLGALESILIPPKFDVFVDHHLKIGFEWARAIEDRIRGADAVIALISDSATSSEMLEYELEIAMDANLKAGKPLVLPVRIGSGPPPESPTASLVNGLPMPVWRGDSDTSRVVAELVDSLARFDKTPSDRREMGGFAAAIMSPSPFYIERESDQEFFAGIHQCESILLVKAPRQMGKTTLIGRGVRYAKQLDYRYAATDFQKLNTALLWDADACYRLLASNLARQLKFDYPFDREWIAVQGPNANLDIFLRTLVEQSERPFVWFMDEVDRLFSASFAQEFFGLVRSWHNSRATDPDGPWERFTVAIAYATEAHLFIQDLNQSPFNVGLRIDLRGFDLREMQELNLRYGSPLKSATQLQTLHKLIEGQPFLARIAMDCLVKSGGDLDCLLGCAHHDDGPFGDHLKRVLVSVSQLRGVLTAMRSSLSNLVLQDSADVQRLVRAGVIVKRPLGNYAIRNELYRRYLSEHLACP